MSGSTSLACAAAQSGCRPMASINAPIAAWVWPKASSAWPFSVRIRLSAGYCWLARDRQIAAASAWPPASKPSQWATIASG